MSSIYIWLTLIIIIFALFISIYASIELYNNIDNYIIVYNNLKGK